jgi:transposase InsO family protein
MVVELQKVKIFVNRKRISLLMKKMGIEAQYRKPNLSKAKKGHKKYPYLLKNFKPSAPNQVWSTDISVLQISSMKDGGRPSAVDLQGEIANYCKRL